MLFNFNTPTEVIFGNGKFSHISKLTEKFGKMPLVVCGKRSMKKYKYLDKLNSFFKKDKKKIIIYNNISPDAKSNEVNEAINVIKNKKVDFIIGLGGGSALDAAKAIGVGVNFKNIEGIIGSTLQDNVKSLPVIAVPTTSGTGSEVSKGAIITDVVKKFKSGIRGNMIFPKMAIIDPMLSLTMPKDVQAETGFDAFTHLLESYLAKKSSNLTEILSLEGISILFKYLPLSLEKRKNLKLREKISFAAYLGGINVANASTCLPHRLQQAMGCVKEISHPHARGLACLYPAWLEEEYRFSRKKIDTIKISIGARGKKFDFILNFMDKIKVNNSLGDYGVCKNHISKFIKNISGNIENDPIKKINSKLIEKIYLKSI